MARAEAAMGQVAAAADGKEAATATARLCGGNGEGGGGGGEGGGGDERGGREAAEAAEAGGRVVSEELKMHARLSFDPLSYSTTVGFLEDLSRTGILLIAEQSSRSEMISD